MKFEEVLPKLRDGEIAYRKLWNDEAYIFINESQTVYLGVKVKPLIVLTDGTGNLSVWVPTMADLLEDDWKIESY